MFAKNLMEYGYKTIVFCANTRHNSQDIIDIQNSKFVEIITEDIPYIFIKTSTYKNNGYSRVKNMVDFYKNLFPVAKEIAKIYGKPDIILASSVHPLTLVAGIKIARKYNIPCICEVRDLWPETLVAYGGLNKNNIIVKLLYSGEKWIYKNANMLIFTMEGGKQYIIDKGWDKENGGPIDISKVYHINNGVDLELFDYNKKHYTVDDDDLNNGNCFKVVYTGSIRKANNLEIVINAAKYIKAVSKKDIKFLIYGDGNEREYLQKKCLIENIDNVVFKGKVNKKNIPYIVSKSDLNILNYSYHDIWKYGGSQNKIFEYLAAGKPVISTIKMGYDILEKFGAGISLNNQSPENIGENILKIYHLPEEKYNNLCKNARRAAQNYDFKVLTKKLVNLISRL